MNQQINDSTKMQMNIIQPHPGPTDENSQVENEAVSIINTMITDKLTLSDTLSDSPEKQTKQQYVFKPIAQSRQVIQHKPKFDTAQTNTNKPKFITKRSNSFIISINADERISELDTPQLRTKSYSNLIETQFSNEIQQEKQIQQQDYRNSFINQRQKIRHQTGPSFGGGDSKIISPNSIPNQLNILGNNNSNVFYYAPHHHHYGSNVSNFSFQQLFLPQQIGQKKSESNSPPAKFGLNEELTSDAIKLEEDDNEDLFQQPFRSKKLTSIESNINNNTNNQSVIYYPTNSLPNQPTKFQLSLYQTDNMQASYDQSQMNITDQNNNTHKSSGEMNDDEKMNNMLTNQQINSEYTQINILSESDARELLKQKQIKKPSYVQVNYGDLPEDIEEDDFNDDEEIIYNKNNKLKINQIQFIEMNKDIKKKSYSVSEAKKSEFKIQVKTPQGRIVQKSPSSKASSKNLINLEKNKINFFDQKNMINLGLQRNQLIQATQNKRASLFSQKTPMSQQSSKKNQKTPKSYLAIEQNASHLDRESGFQNRKSEICANSVSQQRGDQSNLELIPIQSNLLFSSNLFESSQEQELQRKESSNKREKSKSKSLKIQRKQKNIEVEKPYRQEKIMQRVRQFLDILKIRSTLRSHLMIKKKIIEIINDLVYPNKQNISTRTQQQIGNKYSSFRLSRVSSKLPSSISQSQMLNIFYKKLLNTPLFHPQSLFKLTWDFIHVSIILLIFFYIPIQMVTGQNMGILIEAEAEWCRVIFVIFFFFIFDILISFNTGIYDQGIVNENRKDVSMTYIKQQFILDIIYSVCILKSYFSMEADSFFSQICCVALFFKFFTLRKIINNFTDILLSIRNNTKLYYCIELISLLITILFVGHVIYQQLFQIFIFLIILIQQIFACAFWSISETSEKHHAKTWMKKLYISNLGWKTKYLFHIF